jgi:hypothetical protein
MTARSFQFPIPVADSPEGRGARPLFALSAAGGRRREVPRITNVADPRRSFFLSFARGHISSPALVACNLKPLSSAHHRLRFRQHGSTGELGDVPKIMGGPHGGGC